MLVFSLLLFSSLFVHEKQINYRGKCQYCYKNLTTDEITWEYPKLAKTGSPAAGDGTIATEGSTTTKQNTDDTDDAMDISTTPPPNSQENLLGMYKSSSSLNFWYFII